MGMRNVEADGTLGGRRIRGTSTVYCFNGGVCFAFSYYFVVGGRPRKESYKTTCSFRPRFFVLGMTAASLAGVSACFVCGSLACVVTFVSVVTLWSIRANRELLARFGPDVSQFGHGNKKLQGHLFASVGGRNA